MFRDVCILEKKLDRDDEDSTWTCRERESKNNETQKKGKHRKAAKRVHDTQPREGHTKEADEDFLLTPTPTKMRDMRTVNVFFFSFISLIADGPHHYHPACGHKGSSHLSPVHALQFFYRHASSALLQLVNHLVLIISVTKLWAHFTPPPTDHP